MLASSWPMKAPMQTVRDDQPLGEPAGAHRIGPGRLRCQPGPQSPGRVGQPHLLQYLCVRVKNTSVSELLCRHERNTG